MSTLPSPVVVRGNRREVPPGLPILAWWEKVQEYRSQAVEVPWYHPDLEYLSPAALAQIRAKALVWFETTGRWPTDINCWGEIRRGRLNGNVPRRTAQTVGRVDDAGVLHCGECGARVSVNQDGTYGRDGNQRCNCCGIRWEVSRGD